MPGQLVPVPLQHEPVDRAHEPQRERGPTFLAPVGRPVAQHVPARPTTLDIVCGPLQERRVQGGAELRTPPGLLPESLRDRRRPIHARKTVTRPGRGAASLPPIEL